jgi:hypothetical protein
MKSNPHWGSGLQGIEVANCACQLGFEFMGCNLVASLFEAGDVDGEFFAQSCWHGELSMRAGEHGGGFVFESKIGEIGN